MELITGKGGLCERLRKGKGWTRGELASNAGVSIKTISAIEDGSILEGSENPKTKHRQRATGRAIVQTATALGVDPAEWLTRLEESKPLFSFPAEEKADILKAGRRKVRHAFGGDRDIGVFIHDQMRGDGRAGLIEVPVEFRRLGSPSLDEFQVDLVSRIFSIMDRKIHVQDRTDKYKNRINNMFENMLKVDDPTRLLVGPPRVPIREFEMPIEFFDIPGLQMALVALVREGSGLTWPDITENPDNKKESFNLRIYVISQGVGHILVKNYFSFNKNIEIRLIDSLDAPVIESKCRQILLNNTTESGQTAIILNEYTAVQVLRSIAGDTDGDTTRSVGLKILRSDEYPLTFALAFATRSADKEWTRMLKSCVSELFERLPVPMAGLYVTGYLKPLFDELLMHSSIPGDGFEQFGADRQPSSYLQILDNGLPLKFKQALRERLDILLSAPRFSEAINAANCTCDLVIDKILDWH